MAYFIYFVVYSFIGFILETLYTLVTKGIFIWKKCFLFNLLCPVYGFGSIAILWSTKGIREHKIITMIVGGLVATLVEYILHYIYQEWLGVMIWDYSDVSYNINGRICLTFTFFWCILSGILVYFIHPIIEKNMTSIPKSLLLAMLFFIGIDAIISIVLYKRYGNKNAVNINWLLSNLRHKLG
ncbi:MAG: hypothetical protein E7387_00055 [Ruminococcaceae bacterium]|nr:hypothetical protein [Oscillospiraceae bacterium]